MCQLCCDAKKDMQEEIEEVQQDKEAAACSAVLGTTSP